MSHGWWSGGGLAAVGGGLAAVGTHTGIAPATGTVEVGQRGRSLVGMIEVIGAKEPRSPVIGVE